MASIYTRQDSPYFWLKFRGDDGKLHQESTRCRVGVSTEVRKARIMAAEKTAEELRGAGVRHGDGWSWVPEFLKVRYHSNTSFERYNSAWTTIQLFLTERCIETPAQLLRQHCFDYLGWRQRPDKANGKYAARHNTSLLELKTLSLVMQEAVERGIVTGNPCTNLGIKKEKPTPKPELTPADCELIRAEIEKHPNPEERDMLRLSFEIARYQGCRLSETRLDPQTDVDIHDDSRGTIRFRIKGGRNFVTALHPRLIPLFRELKQAGRRETWKTPKKLGRQWASTVWWHFLDRIGLKERGVTFHCCRVTVVTELARNNVSISKAKAFVGHASSTVHEIYQRLKPDDLDDVTRVVG